MQKEYEGIINQARAEHNLGREGIEKLLQLGAVPGVNVKSALTKK